MSTIAANQPPSGGPVWLGVFGKHPAWTDFPEAQDIPDSDSKTSAMIARADEQLLGAIEQLIKSKCWHPRTVVANSESEEWHFLSQDGLDVLAGVMWPSMDKSGRDDYPMVVAAHLNDVDLVWVELKVLPVLQEAATSMRLTQSREGVNDLVKETKSRIREMVLAGTGKDPDYGATAEACLDPANYQESMFNLERLFHAINSKYGEFAIGVAAGTGVNSPVPPLRLPWPIDNGSAPMASWIVLLRSQIMDRVPVFVIHAKGVPFCDIVVGRFWFERFVDNRTEVINNLDGIQKPLSERKTDLDDEMQLERRFESQVPGFAAAVKVPWGRADKITVFGPAPRDYAPQLPGCSGIWIKPAIAHKEALGQPVQRARKETTGIRSWWKQSGELLTQLDTKKRDLVLAGVAAGVLGLLVLASLLLLHRRTPDSGESRRSEPPVASVTPSSSQPDMRVAGTSRQVEDRGQRWFEYVNDYDRWFWAASDSNTLAGINSPFLTERIAAVNVLRSLPTLDPLALLGNSDPYNRIAPSKTLLEKTNKSIESAVQVADQVRRIFSRDFPDYLGEQSDSLNKAGFAGISAAFSSQISGERPILGAFVAAVTNTPPKSPPDRGDWSNELVKVSRWEISAGGLMNRLTNWNHLRESLLAFNGTRLQPLLEPRQSDFATVTNFTQAAKALDDLISQGAILQSWLNVNWTNVDASSFATDFATGKPVSFSDWLILAGASVRLTISDDPRAPLRAAVKRDALADLAKDLRSDTKPGSRAATWLSNWDDFNSRLMQVEAIGGLRRNLDVLSERTAGLQSAYEKLRPEQWPDLFDLTVVLKQQGMRSLNDPNLDKIWRDYLSMVGKTVQATDPNSASLLFRVWRQRWEGVQNLLADLKAKKLDLPDSLPPFTRPQENVGLESPLSLLRQDYLRDLAWLGIDAATLAPVSTADQVLASPERARLDTDVRNWWNALVSFRVAVSEAEQNRDIPASFEAFRTNGEVIASGSGRFSCLLTNAEISRVRALAEQCIARNGENAGGAQHQAIAPEWAVLEPLLSAAKFDALGNLPRTDAELSRLATVAAGLKSLDPTSKAPDWKKWLQRKWSEIPADALTFDGVNLWTSSLKRDGFQTEDFPQNLAWNESLGNLRSRLNAAAQSDSQAILTEFADILKPVHPSEGGISNLNILLAIYRALSGGLSATTSWDKLSPVAAGGKVRPLSAEEVALELRDLKFLFRLVTPSSGGPFFLAETEISSAQLAALSQMAEKNATIMGNSFNAQFADFMANSFAEQLGPIWDDPVKKLRVFEHPVFALYNVLPQFDTKGKVRSLVARPARVPSPELADGSAVTLTTNLDSSPPANFLSAAWATDVARAVGCRLPSPAEWRVVDQLFTASDPGNFQSQSLARFFSELSARVSISQKDLRARMLYARMQDEGHSNPTPADTLFTPVLDTNFLAHGFYHWRGNVAETLQENGRFFVAGGSLASSPTGPFAPVEVPAGNTNRGYADVGLRLAFDWQGEQPVAVAKRLALQLKPEVAQ